MKELLKLVKRNYPDNLKEKKNKSRNRDCFYISEKNIVLEKFFPRNIYFAKVRKEAIIPSKREEDGAFDIYACFEEDYIIIQPHETKMIPTGLCSAFSSDYVAILKERGSTGTKGIGQRAGVVDSGYRGEWFVPLTNHNVLPLVIAKNGIDTIKQPHIKYPYEKAICQCIMLEVPKLKVKEVSLDKIKSIKSERGKGCLGSSKK